MAVHKVAVQGFQHQTAAYVFLTADWVIWYQNKKITLDINRYERGRPGYPESAINWLFKTHIKTPVNHLVDIGAGTGILSFLENL